MRAATVSLVILASAGCQGDSRALKALEEKVQVLEAANSEAKTYVDLLEKRLINLELDRPLREGTFTPNSTSYQQIFTEGGTEYFLVSLQSVTPYANGYRARFHFGNPQAADFEGVSIDFKWGPSRPKPGSGADYGEWLKKFLTGSQKIPRRLRSGAWNPVEVVLAPATAEQVGQIEITKISSQSAFMLNN